ncbi:MAG: hypothetical protein RL204_392 [Bacteroidota bacterium]
MIPFRIILIAIYALVFYGIAFALNRLARKLNWKEETFVSIYFFLAFATAVLQKDAPYFSFNNAEILFGLGGVVAFSLGTFLSEKAQKSSGFVLKLILADMACLSFTNFQISSPFIWAFVISPIFMFLLDSKLASRYTLGSTLILALFSVFIGTEIFLGIVFLAAILAFLIYHRRNSSSLLLVYVQVFLLLNLLKSVLELF